MKKLISLLLIICLSLSLLAGCKDNEDDNNITNDNTTDITDKDNSTTDTTDKDNSTTDTSGKDDNDGENNTTSSKDNEVGTGACYYATTRNNDGHDLKYVKISVKGHGSIVLLLDATVAPVTVANFMKLVNEGFYNGLTFHRIIDDFMIQGGDPKADGTGGSDETIKGEFSANNHENDISHIRGVISMARAGSQTNPASAYNTASSQFFICNENSTFLDGQYAAFGYVLAGLSVVDSITKEGVKEADYYTGTIEDKEKQPKINSITELSEADASEYFGEKKPAIDSEKIGTGACELVEDRDTEGHEIKYVKITVKDHGTIVLMLDATTAPITVANFLKLANEGFYNGLTFHRILSNFMIQGGDPKADGTGGSDETIKGEFTANGVENDISHLRGVISMARNGYSMNSASSQFFICNADAPHLDGQYAAFGYVLAGLSVVDSITKDGMNYTSSDVNGAISYKKDQPVIISATEISKEEAFSLIK